MKAIGIYLVILEIKEKPAKTKSGLILTDKLKEDVRNRKGIVKSVGDMVERLKIGDEIYYYKHAGFNVEIDENLFLVIKQQDVVIVL